MEKLLKQIGMMNISKHHLIRYSEIKKPTINILLTNIISPTKFKSRRKGVPATGYYRFFVIDWDDKKKGFKETLHTLRMGNISYFAFPSPSHWVKPGYRMRILIPVSGTMATTKEGYEVQYLAFLAELGLPIPDKSASDTKRLFYPPVMKNIVQVPSGKPKPTNQSFVKSRKKIESYYGKKFPVRSVQESMEMTAEIYPKMYAKKKSTGKFERSTREEVFFSKDTVMYHKGKKIGSLEELVKDGNHHRCDCPFEGNDKHSDRKGGRDQAFVQGDRIICTSNTHGHVIGRMDIFS